MASHRFPPLIVAFFALVAGAMALSLRVADLKQGAFWSDEATYHSVAYSLAYDLDLHYERSDLERVYALGYAGGPSGLFLVRNPGDGQLYYAKSWIYPLFAAPFVRALGDNGFFVLHAVLLALMLGAGYAYLRRSLAAPAAALWTVTFLFAWVGPLYFFWLTPEWFNIALVFLATFLWLYKEPGATAGGAATGPGEVPADDAADRPAPPCTWLCGGWTDLAAAGLYGLVVFSKPPNALLVLPFLAWPLLRGRWVRAVVSGAIVAGIVLGCFAITQASLGSWNYQGGDRRTFQADTAYPFQNPERTFDNTGVPMTTAVEELAGFFPGTANLARDLVFAAIGRNGGWLPYMFPACLALLLFAASGRAHPRSPRGLLALACVLEVVAIILVVKGNWIGGGGTVGSRYFANVYPALFFLLPAGTGLVAAAASWAVWGLFLAQILLDPFRASANPGFHTKHFPFSLLPAELTILHNLPFNTNSRARLQELEPRARYLAYFLDDNTWLREGQTGGFWVRGGREAEVVLRTRIPAQLLTLDVRNRGTVNEVVVQHAGERLHLRLEPGESRRIEIPAAEAVEYGGTWLYRFSVGSTAATVPMFDTPGSNDYRSLGVLVRPTLEPAIEFRER